MFGKKKGVVALFKKEIGFLLGIHCICHRLALALGDAGDDVAYVHNVFKPVLSTVFWWYQMSGKNTARLADADIFGDAVTEDTSPDRKGTKLADQSDTRWLSCDAAVQKMHKNLLRVILDINKKIKERGKADAVAIGLHKLLRSVWFIACLHLFKDLMPLLNRVSLVFQSRNLDLGTFLTELPVVRKSLEAMLVEPPPADSFQTQLPQFFKQLLDKGIELVAQRQYRDVRSALGAKEGLKNQQRAFNVKAAQAANSSKPADSVDLKAPKSAEAAADIDGEPAPKKRKAASGAALEAKDLPAMEEDTSESVDVRLANFQQRVKRPFIQAILARLEQRFPAQDLEILRALNTLLNPTEYPAANSAGLSVYGLQAVESLQNHFMTPAASSSSSSSRSSAVNSDAKAGADVEMRDASPACKYPPNFDLSNLAAELPFARLLILEYRAQFNASEATRVTNWKAASKPQPASTADSKAAKDSKDGKDVKAF